MNISRIDLKRDEVIIKLEPRKPSPKTATPEMSITDTPELPPQVKLAVLQGGRQAEGICQGGVCQLGSWRPNRNVA